MLELKPQFPWKQVLAYNDTPHEVISFMSVCVHVCQPNVITSRQKQCQIYRIHVQTMKRYFR